MPLQSIVKAKGDPTPVNVVSAEVYDNKGYTIDGKYIGENIDINS